MRPNKIGDQYRQMRQRQMKVNDEFDFLMEKEYYYDEEVLCYTQIDEFGLLIEHRKKAPKLITLHSFINAI